MKKSWIFVGLLFISSAAPDLSWALAPRARFSRDFDVMPFLQVSPERADRLATLLPRRPYVILDFESTGLNARHAKPIEVAALKFIGTRCVGKFYSLIDPQEPLEPIITEINGLTDAMLRGQPTAAEVLPKLLEFTNGCDLVGHNISSFDVQLFENQLHRLGLHYARRPFVHDTRKMGHIVIRRGGSNGQVTRYKLQDLARLAGSPIIPDHNSLKDTVANAYIFWDLLEKEVRLKRRFTERFDAEWMKMADHFTTLMEYLQGNDRLSEVTAPLDLTAIFSADRLDWIDKVVGGYQQGRIKKMVVFAEGSRNTREGLTSLSDSCEKEMTAQGIAREDIFFERRHKEINERLEFVASQLKRQRIWKGKIAVIVEWRQLRRCRLAVQRLKRNKIFPDGVNVLFIPLERVNRDMAADRVQFKKMVGKALMEYETLIHHTKEGWIDPFIPPKNVAAAYHYFVEMLDLSAAACRPILESSL